MFKAPFSYNGRIRRTEFVLSYLIYFVGLYSSLFLVGLNEDFGGIFILLFIPFFWFLTAQAAKRCHDRGNSGWFQLVPFYVFWMIFAESEDGENDFGPNPKNQGNIDDLNEIGSGL